MPLKQILLPLLVVITAAVSGGCLFDQPNPQKNDIKPDSTLSSAASQADTTSTPSETEVDDQSVSELFSVRNKVNEVRFQYVNGQPSYAMTQAESVLPMLRPDSRERLELYFLMARCCEQLGRKKDRKRHDKSFRELLEKLGRSKEHQQANADGKNVQKLVEQSIEQAKPLREKSVFDSDDELFNIRCFRKLKRAAKHEVLEENLDDSGRIFYGMDASEVIASAASAIGLNESDIIIQKDTRFYFYYTIIENERY